MFQCQHRGIQLRGAANAADTGRNHQRILGLTADEDLFEPPVQGADTPGIDDFVVFDFQLKIEIAFDSVKVDLNGPSGHR
jgi:hypothetical protein